MDKVTNQIGGEDCFDFVVVGALRTQVEEE